MDKEKKLLKKLYLLFDKNEELDKALELKHKFVNKPKINYEKAAEYRKQELVLKRDMNKIFNKMVKIYKSK